MVNMNPQVITEGQLGELYNVLSNDVKLTGNNRNIQDRNDRTIFRFSNTWSSGTEMNQASAMVTVGSALAVVSSVICLMSI